MLVLTRRLNESFTVTVPVLGAAPVVIEIVIMGVTSRSDRPRVRVGINAPKAVAVVRDDAKKLEPRDAHAPPRV